MEAAMAATDLNGNRRRQPPPELLSDFLVAGGGREYHIWSDFAFGTDYKLQFLHWNRKLKVERYIPSYLMNRMFSIGLKE
ncbi:hypothetical protein L2E82_49957 [Cichorium intybus]|nr:hypothetical protein L2E82_49957 [Cichorium intybus]